MSKLIHLWSMLPLRFAAWSCCCQAHAHAMQAQKQAAEPNSY